MANLFAEKITQLRRLREWSRMDLAKKLGVHCGTVGEWERGKRLPHPVWKQWIETELARAQGKTA